MLNAVNAELGGRWQVERRLTGGWNEGAYLLSRPGGSRVVLKWRASEPERLLGARERVEVARARGWPAPAWLAAGRAPAGGAWVVQEFIDGRTPPRLDDFVAEQMTGILGLQAGLFPARTAAGGSGQPGWCSRTGTACGTGSGPASLGVGGSWQPSTPSPGPARLGRCPARIWSMGTSTWLTPSPLPAGSGWWTLRAWVPGRVPTIWPRRCWSVPGRATSPKPPRPGCGPTAPGWTAGSSRSAPGRSA